ncbi:hypothetical protein QBC32DRAFT_196008, partial [Pseudoneurospora amorphoporcata]
KETEEACGSMGDAIFVARVKFKLEAVLEHNPSMTPRAPSVPILPSLKSVRPMPKCGAFL